MLAFFGGQVQLAAAQKRFSSHFATTPAARADSNCEPRLGGRGSRGFAKRFGALAARADAPQIVVAEDARGVAVGEIDLNRVIPHLRGALRARLWLIHGKRR